MTRKARWLSSWLLALIFILGILAGCSKPAEQPKKEEPKAAQPAPAPAPAKPAEQPAPAKEELVTVIVHYHSTNGDYEGVEVFAQADGVPGKAYKFYQTDKFGAKSTFAIYKNVPTVKFEVRKNGKAITKELSVTLKDGKAETWLISGKEGQFASEADATKALPEKKKVGMIDKLTGPGVIIHYKRADGNYKGWDMWLWPKGGEGKAVKFEGVAEGGAYAIVPVPAGTTEVGFLVRCCNGGWDKKDWDADRFITLENGKAEVWVLSGKEKYLLDGNVALNAATADVPAPASQNEEPKKEEPKAVVTTPAGKTVITIHYTRPDAKYEGWDLWTWADGVDGKAYSFTPGPYGARSQIVLDKAIAKLGFIVRQGGDKWEGKDVDKDRFIEVKDGKAEVWLTSGKEEVAATSPGDPAKSVVVIHYSRPDGAYKDWDLWTWADGVDGSATAFTGTDKYGGVAVVTLPKNVAKMGFLVRKGGDKWEAKDPDKDRTVNLTNGFAEVWLKSGSEEVAYAEPPKGTTIVVHYNRKDGDYKSWDLWTWADGVDGKAYAFTAKDNFGGVAKIEIPDKVISKMGFIVRKGGDKWEAKDVETDRSITVVNGVANVWLMEGKEAVLTEEPGGTEVVINYHRPDGNYADWDVWLWADGVNGQAVKFTEVAGFGARATVRLDKAVSKVGYIIRKGGDKWEGKDVDADRSIETKDGKAHAWVVSGDAATYTSAAATGLKTSVTVRYIRTTDANYEPWDLWVWGDGVDGHAQKFTGRDLFAGVSTFTVGHPVDSLGFIVRKGGDTWAGKDVDADRAIKVTNLKAEVFIKEGQETIIYDIMKLWDKQK